MHTWRVRGHVPVATLIGDENCFPRYLTLRMFYGIHLY